MLTRAQVHYALPRVGAAAGAIALPLFLFCLVGSFVIRGGTREFQIADGAIELTWHDTRIPMIGGRPAFPAPAPEPEGIFLQPSTGQWAWHPEWHGPGGPMWSGNFILPLWIPVALGALAGYFLLPPGTTRGRCPACTYDLRGVPAAPDGARQCPECGTISEHSANTKSRSSPPHPTGTAHEAHSV